MSVTDLHPAGCTRITEAQFAELQSKGGAPHDIVQEVGRLGMAFVSAAGGVVQAWHLEGVGHFLQTPGSFAEALKILTPG